MRALGADLNATTNLPGITVAVAQIKAQQDAKLVTWTAAAAFEAHGVPPSFRVRAAWYGFILFFGLKYANLHRQGAVSA